MTNKKIKEEKYEDCDICGMKYNKEMYKIASKFFGNDDPCFCKSIKKIERLSKENNHLRKLNQQMFDYLLEEDLWTSFCEYIDVEELSKIAEKEGGK
jgi:hypothetical protein